MTFFHIFGVLGWSLEVSGALGVQGGDTREMILSAGALLGPFRLPFLKKNMLFLMCFLIAFLDAFFIDV